MRGDDRQKRRIGTVALVALAVAAVVLAGVAPASAREDGSTVREFKLQYVSVKDAAAAITPLLSEKGSVSLQPSQSRISVQDRPEVIKKVAERLAVIDRKPGGYVLQVELLEGVKGELPAKLRAEVSRRVLKTSRFTSFRRISLTTLEGELGTAVEAELGEGYHLSFEPAQYDSPVHIRGQGSVMELRKALLERAKKAGDEPVVVVRITGVLSENQEIHQEVAPSEDATSGVVLIFKALKVAGG